MDGCPPSHRSTTRSDLISRSAAHIVDITLLYVVCALERPSQRQQPTRVHLPRKRAGAALLSAAKGLKLNHFGLDPRQGGTGRGNNEGTFGALTREVRRAQPAPGTDSWRKATQLSNRRCDAGEQPVFGRIWNPPRGPVVAHSLRDRLGNIVQAQVGLETQHIAHRTGTDRVLPSIRP
jgi:hypothetical protein